MPLISYAQNYEDVVLWRALRDVELGFYVDVGAADPQEYSVTKVFYDKGWSGINVEPLDEYFEKLRKARPRDTNINAAAGREAGLRTLYAIAGTGLSTLDSDVAAQQQLAGWQARKAVVPVVTLTRILEDCAPPTIHFLKIDVEGAETEVLEGLDLRSVRPWIIVVEATAPGSQVSTRDNWENLITDHGYCFAYFDGLNCFYVADEMASLRARLAVPPNVFDQFVSWSEWSNQQRAADLEKELKDSRAHADWLKSVSAETSKLLEAARLEGANLRHALQAKQTQVQSRLEYLSAEIQKLEAQLAVPSIDRALGRFVSRLRQAGDRVTGGGLRAFANRTATASFRRYSSFAARHPRLAAPAVAALKPFLRARGQPTPAAVPVTVISCIDKEEVRIDLLPGQPHRVEIPFSAKQGAVLSDIPASARSTYLKLHSAIFERNPRDGAQ
jgi:FkbM family methyltransferase